MSRLPLSGVLPVEMQQELTEVAHALDPIRVFSVERCTAGPLPEGRSVPDPAAVLHTFEEQWQAEVIRGRSAASILPAERATRSSCLPIEQTAG